MSENGRGNKDNNSKDTKGRNKNIIVGSGWVYGSVNVRG